MTLSIRHHWIPKQHENVSMDTSSAVYNQEDPSQAIQSSTQVLDILYDVFVHLYKTLLTVQK